MQPRYTCSNGQGEKKEFKNFRHRNNRKNSDDRKSEASPLCRTSSVDPNATAIRGKYVYPSSISTHLRRQPAPLQHHPGPSVMMSTQRAASVPSFKPRSHHHLQQACPSHRPPFHFRRCSMSVPATIPPTLIQNDATRFVAKHE
jgi:hypothetical protein